NQTTEKKENPPYPVYKISESEFHLPCSVCGRVSLILRMGIGSYKDSHSLKYLGITHSRDLDSKHAKKFFKFLSENNIKSAHEYFITKIDEYGFDSFCPACGKIYCSEHYGMKQYIEDGYYDYTEGTCPEGHTRILDD
ncbi:MAG: hypothetical protein PHV06_09325, partial [bacterium]|nr:hypothetical protein [bacterium]